MGGILFVDPIADLAVLGGPDNQVLSEKSDAYDDLVEGRSALPVGVVTATCEAWLLTLAGQWERCSVRVDEYGPAKWLTLVAAKDGNLPGTSGSPIVTADRAAVSVVSVESQANGDAQVEQPMQPRLAMALPVWLLGEVR
jgi:hypothetical protein